jgi:hypothetical protein
MNRFGQRRARWKTDSGPEMHDMPTALYQEGVALSVISFVLMPVPTVEFEGNLHALSFKRNVNPVVSDPVIEFAADQRVNNPLRARYTGAVHKVATVGAIGLVDHVGV